MSRSSPRRTASITSTCSQASSPAPRARSISRVDIGSIVRLAQLGDYVVAFAIRAVCELGVADHFGGGSRSVEQLAASVGAHPGALYRLLRTLAFKGLFSETGPGWYELTPMGHLLRSDHPLSMRAALPLLAPDLDAWAHLDHSIRTGGAAFEHVSGMSYYRYLRTHPLMSRRVDSSIESVNRVVTRTLVRACDWSRYGTLADIGGGNGSFLAGVLARHRDLHAILFDLPHVTEHAGEVLREAGVAERCEIIAGDYFAGVPQADAYVLKTVLHDWDDSRAIAILRNIVAVMPKDGRVLLLEALLSPDNAFDVGKLMDINSLVLAGGPDRRVEDYESLLQSAGLELLEVRRTSHALSILIAARMRGSASPDPR